MGSALYFTSITLWALVSFIAFIDFLYFYQAVTSESRNSPFILFMKDAEKSIVGNSESYSTFKSRLEKLPDNVIIIGSHTQSDNRKEKVMLVCLIIIICLNLFISWG